MGEATFLIELGNPQPVRAVTMQELKNAARQMKGADGKQFFALLALRGALESGDNLALDKAKELMEHAYRLREAEKLPTVNPEVDWQLGELFARDSGLTPEETSRYLSGFRPGPRARENPSRLLSYEVSKAIAAPLDNAQIVLWWMNGAFRPAIYCPDTKTALYVHTFFIAPVGGPGFRICPYDGEQFFQDRPNQDYCCPAHREAHRVARWRDERRNKLAVEKGRKGKKNVTQKAR